MPNILRPSGAKIKKNNKKKIGESQTESLTDSKFVEISYKISYK
jgi:hypothetical protein